MRGEDLTPDLVRQVTRLAGLDLAPERAADLVPLLQSVLEGDARIARLDLGPLSALGPPWTEGSRE